MTILEGTEAALFAGAKGAAAGMALGPVGAAVGGLVGIASSLLSTVLPETAKPALQAAARAITGQETEIAQATAIATDPAMAQQFHVEALKVAQSLNEQQEITRRAEVQAAVDGLKAQLADTANARSQTIEFARMGSKLQWAAPVVSLVVTVGFFFMFGLLMITKGDLDPNRAAIINILVGSLGTAFAGVINYWLGSTAQGARKTELLAQSVPASLLPNPAKIEPADTSVDDSR